MRKIFKDEPIQWHISSTKYDRNGCCPGHGLGFLSRRERACMAPECDRVYSLSVNAKRWADGLIASGAEMVPANKAAAATDRDS